MPFAEKIAIRGLPEEWVASVFCFPLCGKANGFSSSVLLTIWDEFLDRGKKSGNDVCCVRRILNNKVTLKDLLVGDLC